MSEPTASPSGFERLKVRQKLTLMVNRYEILQTDEQGTDLGLICFAEQKQMAFKEQVTFYTDAAKTHPLFGFTARKVIDLGSGYDVVDAAGQPIGWFKKEFAASLGRSTWQLGTPDGFSCVGQERNAKVAVLRRIWDLVPVVGDIPVPWLFHFDFRAGDGAIVMSSTKKVGLKDTYFVDLPGQSNGWRLDWRVAAAMAVALDALQSR
ncbi:hypothetical protein N864_22755 [Intrasporangium chromatireducens Q5-1]|uniref:Uncharacterized protein n=1 Tax=Intrasporangium chromatireducens Q5-1 TaxID=584657 RepID=W9GJ66_9MICO|nr:hypothetical protein [Intrasporangium chromatireducens]EWT06286.1 hypothetical protein N864_22755 [Intrasporangium chromatireducens Q5-1]